VIKTEITLRSENNKFKVSDLIKFTEKLKALYPMDQEYFYVELTHDSLTAYDEEE
jgi:hypothetical protein